MRAGTRLTGAGALALALAAPACAQTLDARVTRSSGDVVQFHFAAREGVCGDGRGMLRVESSTWVTSSGTFSDITRCETGPVRALITKDGNEVLRIQFVAGPLTLAEGATDLGVRLAILDALAEDGSRPALDKLLAVAGSTADAAVRRRAVTKLGESGDPRARELLRELARDS